MDDYGASTSSALTCGLLMLTLAGCATSWSEERQKHYSWLYQKCMHGEHEPYTIYMNRNPNASLSERCHAEYHHYVGTINGPSAIAVVSDANLFQ
jgi:hypothetical protein